MTIHMLIICMMHPLNKRERLLTSHRMGRNLKLLTRKLVLTVQRIYSRVSKALTSLRDLSRKTLAARCQCRLIIRNQRIPSLQPLSKTRIKHLKSRAALKIENSQVIQSISFILIVGSILDVQNRNQLKNLIID